MSLVSVQKKTLNLLSYGYQRVSGKTVCKGAGILIKWQGITHNFHPTLFRCHAVSIVFKKHASLSVQLLDKPRRHISCPKREINLDSSAAEMDRKRFGPSEKAR